MSVGRGVIFKKRLVSQGLALDMSYLTKRFPMETASESTLRWYRGSGEVASLRIRIHPPESISLIYRYKGGQDEERRLNYSVALVTTPLNFCGCRWWFLCPDCQRRCRILYLPCGEQTFACRLCHRLTYRSQQEARNLFYWLRLALLDSEKILNKLSRTSGASKKKNLLRRLDRISAGMEQTRIVRNPGQRSENE